MNLDNEVHSVLCLLPLALLPFFRPDRTSLSYGWLALMPRDYLATLVGLLLKLIAAITITVLILGLAGLRRSAGAVGVGGHGAQIVVLLDRSRSMDESFNQGRVNHDPSKAFNAEQAREIKGKVARQILAEFASKRSQDMFGMVVFSSRSHAHSELHAKTRGHSGRHSRRRCRTRFIGNRLGARATFRAHFFRQSTLHRFPNHPDGVGWRRSNRR